MPQGVAGSEGLLALASPWKDTRSCALFSDKNDSLVGACSSFNRRHLPDALPSCHPCLPNLHSLGNPKSSTSRLKGFHHSSGPCVAVANNCDHSFWEAVPPG
jgi:hypothetical protein